jgi:hypothetical protein
MSYPVLDNEISIERLREVLDYNPHTGDLTWLVTLSNRNQAGSIAGGLNWSRYRRISVDGIRMKAHRIAWAIHYGEWPEAEIDHINRNKDDNRIENLRVSDRTQQLHNTKMRCDNLSGRKGVSFRKDTGRWTASITINKHTHNLGCYGTFEEACAVRERAEGEMLND